MRKTDRALCLSSIVCIAACATEAPAPPAFRIEGNEDVVDPVSDGEGEDNDDPPVTYEHDGAPIEDGTLTVALESGPLSLDLGVRNETDADVLLLSDPTILVSGDHFAIVAQPSDVIVAPRASLPFTLTYDGPSGGTHDARLLLAYGVEQADRAALHVIVEGAGRAPGVRTSIYDGTFDALPDFATLTPTERGTTPTFDASARTAGDLFAYLFEGVIEIPADGDYTFFTTSDDGSRLAIDDAVVVDNDGLHGALEIAGVVTLAAGSHAIRVEFFEKLGAASLLVEWQGPGVARAEIPATVLFEQ